MKDRTVGRHGTGAIDLPVIVTGILLVLTQGAHPVRSFEGVLQAIGYHKKNAKCEPPHTSRLIAELFSIFGQGWRMEMVCRIDALESWCL